MPSGALSTPSQTGSQASGAEPGRPAAPQPEWLDLALLYRQHHADLVRLALLLVGDRGCAEDVVQDVSSLSWTGDIRELAVLGQWCKVASDPGGESCPRWERQAQLRAINPAGPGGGSVLAGRLLLRQAPLITRSITVPWRPQRARSPATAGRSG